MGGKKLTKNISILKKIVDQKKKEIQSLSKSRFVNIEKINNIFLQVLQNQKQNSNLSIIAECKKGSPSAGVIVSDYDPVLIAKEYQNLGATAISVLTDETFFFGNLKHLRNVSQKVKLPVLRKDFIISEIQIYQSRYYGASAFLLIAAILTEKELRRFREIGEELGMDALVEVHDIDELKTALTSGAKIIGINNRNLKDFSTDLNNTIKVASKLKNYCEKLKMTGMNSKNAGPNINLIDDPIIISESAIHTGEDVKHIRKWVDGILVGISLLKGDKKALFRQFQSY